MGAVPRFLVMGCGGLGGVATALLTEAGVDVTAVTTNVEIAAAVAAKGLVVKDEAGTRTTPFTLATAVPEGPFDFAILATQPPQVEQAARAALPALAPSGAMVCLQNGLCEARVAKIAGEDRTLGAVVAWGASMIEPGLYERTSAGGFTLGRLDGRPDARLDELARALEAIGSVELTDNLSGKRWSKLAINCAISSLGTIGGDRLGVLLGHRYVRRLALEVMTEVVLVARKEGVRLEKVAGTIDLDWIALRPEERTSSGSGALVAKHALLLAVGLRYRRLRSSMLAAIERGRTPAVDYLNGEVVERAARHGILVPINTIVREDVWRLARGEAGPGLERLRALYDQTRGDAAE